MPKKCTCTVGWVTDIDSTGSAEMTGVGCEELRAALWKMTSGGERLSKREKKIIDTAKERGW